MTAASFLLAMLAGWAVTRARIAGGAMIAALVVTVGIGQVVPLAAPVWADAAVTVVLSAVLAVRVDRSSLAELRPVLWPATLAAVLLILAGLVSAGLLRVAGLAPAGDTLATSPGAIAVMSAAALENDLDAPVVVLYQTIRIAAVILSIPLVGRLVPPLPDVAAHPGAAAGVMGPDGRLGSAGGAPPMSRPVLRGGAVLAGAILGAALLEAVGVALPLVLSSFVGAAVVAVAVLPRRLAPPALLGTGTQAAFGWVVGTLVTGEVLRGLGRDLPAAIASAVLLILAGIGIAALLRRTGRGVAGDVLATSPGALEVLALAAAERGTPPLEVALFHLVRLLAVFVSLPLLLALARS